MAMATRSDAPSSGRDRGRAGDARARQDRTRIAQTAARLIAEHGLTDWGLAKRKAARQLLLPDSAALPGNDEIEEALASYHALFAADTHDESLRTQRLEALVWMRRLAQWDPLLVGGVAAGWAPEHSDVRLELVADDAKAVEIMLASAGVHYAALPARAADAGAHLLIETPRVNLRLSILTPQQRRNRPRRDDEPRLAADAVAALVGG
jgi:phage tail protein X